MNTEFCQNFEAETGQIETSLDPINSPVKDEAAMNVLRLESRLASVVDYLARLKVAVSRIDTTLWPRETLQNDLECGNGRSLPPGVVLMLLCPWYVFTARMHERTSWRPSRWPIPRSMTSNLSWRPSLLLPLGLQMESTWTSLSRLPVLHPRSKKLLCLMP